MIGLPTRGMIYSAAVHRSDLYSFCDWIEASCVFMGKEITGSELVDLLMENNIYKSQEFAWAFVHNALMAIDSRSRLLGDGYPVVSTMEGCQHRGEWEDYTPYVFCLMLSLARSHGDWVKDTFGTNFTEQGELFEDLTAEVLPLMLPGWKVHSTGWTRTRTAQIKRTVEELATLLNEAAGDVYRWTKATAKEAGLDLVSYRPFPDGNVGVPVYLWQCASGQDWKQKQKTPDLDIWTRIVSWAVHPKRAMSMPYALNETDLRQHSAVVAGLLFDRHRLLEPGINQRDWVSANLRTRLIDWLWPRIAMVPLHETVV